MIDDLAPLGVIKGARIAVALSGGVDSAVVAALLKEQGAAVLALTMLLQPGDTAADAAQVAQSLSIPHEIIDLSALFKAEVMEPFADSYAQGDTPSPCVRCNRLIKFGALMDVAKARGAVALATGHYARRIETPEGAQLYQGTDPVRDQSYFLSMLTQAQIDFMRLPLGALSKEETRALAARYALPVAQKKDSQDICFVPCGAYADIVRNLRPEAFVPGTIVDESGAVLGRHEGIVHFTVGQRKGLHLGLREGDHNEPLYVLSLDAARARVIVGPRERLAGSTVSLDGMNWLGAPVPAEGMRVSVKLRSSQSPVVACLSEDLGRGPDCARLRLDAPVMGIAKGQAAALYDGARLLGGARIGGV